jgi:hypothetical protein
MKDKFDLAAYIQKSTKKSGGSLKVKDKSVLVQVAQLLKSVS